MGRKRSWNWHVARPPSVLLAGALGLILSAYASVGAIAQTTLRRSAVPSVSDLERQRQQWFYSQRAYPFAFVPAGSRRAAFDQLGLMRAAEAAAGGGAQPTWRLIGPRPVDTPYPDAVVSGRVAALAVDPRNPRTVFLGAAQGGVWKTTDGGAIWQPLTDDQPSLAIGSLALDPRNANIIYAGTGEENFSGDSYYGAGILKSTDGGITWSQFCGPFCGPIGPDSNYGGGAHIGSLAVDPNDDRILLAGVQLLGKDGIYRSTDGGVTWAPVLSGNPGTSVIFDPTDCNIAYAALGNVFPGGTTGVYRSADAGKSWVAGNGTGVSRLPLADAGRIVLAIAHSAPRTLYAGIANLQDGSLLGIFKTANGGAQWQQLAVPAYCTPQCWYDNTIAVDPKAPNIVYAGGTANFGGPNLIRSLDGGATWTVPPSASVHSDLHALAFSADGGTLYLGNDGGVYRATQISAAAPRFQPLNNTLAITQFYPGLSINPTNSNIAIGGTQDNGTDMYSGLLSWAQVTCGDGGYTAIDPLQTKTIYAACNHVYIQKSTTSGACWILAQNGVNTGDRVDFIPPLTLNGSRSETLYFGTFRVYQTVDGAVSWNAISPDLTNGPSFWGVVTTIAVAPSAPNTVYAGTGDRNVQVTSNAGAGVIARWTNVARNLPPRVITAIAVDPTARTTAYVAFSGFSGLGDRLGHVFRSVNGGASWLDVSANLPNTPVNAIVINPRRPSQIFIGTDSGVFFTDDAAAGWRSLVNGLPRVAVLGLALYGPTGILRASTHGRSVWDIDISQLR